MSETSAEVIRRYLEDAIAAEEGFESQLRSFADDVDDDVEVQRLFADHAEQTSSQITRLDRRLEALGGVHSKAKSLLAQLFTLGPKVAQVSHSKEERLTQNLITAYSVEMSECAMYEALRTVSQLAGDSVTTALVSEIVGEERETAIKIWQLIPSRSKIAYNILTIGEVDPSVETRTSDDRIL